MARGATYQQQVFPTALESLSHDVDLGHPFKAVGERYLSKEKGVFSHARLYTVLHTGGTEHVRNGKSRDVARAQGVK